MSRILVIGNRGGTNVGGCFERAAIGMGHDISFLESSHAMKAWNWLRRLNWHARGHRPTWLGRFSRQLLRRVKESDLKPELVLCTGQAPITLATLQHLERIGVAAVNFATDDPWNPSRRAAWFLRALPGYAQVFSPRKSNLEDLSRLGCRHVAYLPFGYDPGLHFPEQRVPSPAHHLPATCDLLIVGGADDERVRWCKSILDAGLSLAVYGDYWGRYAQTRKVHRGYGDPEEIRAATAQARVSLCLTRRANRDGHTMRTFEAAAMGACILAEKTPEHLEIFGPDGEAAMYFSSADDLVRKARSLLGNEPGRQRLAAVAQRRITTGENTYGDRLRTILQTACPAR